MGRLTAYAGVVHRKLAVCGLVSGMAMCVMYSTLLLLFFRTIVGASLSQHQTAILITLKSTCPVTHPPTAMLPKVMWVH